MAWPAHMKGEVMQTHPPSSLPRVVWQLRGHCPDKANGPGSAAGLSAAAALAQAHGKPIQCIGSARPSAGRASKWWWVSTLAAGLCFAPTAIEGTAVEAVQKRVDARRINEI